MGALIFRRGDILLVERGKPPLMGWWSLPGGALETGETLEEAVSREVLEETGLVVRPAGVAEIFERIMRDEDGRAEYHYVLVDFFCRVSGGTLTAGDDVSRAEWVPKHRLGEYHLTEGTLDVIQRAMRRRAAGLRTGTRISGARGTTPRDEK